jgi:Phage terminase-like protein, large subunit
MVNYKTKVKNYIKATISGKRVCGKSEYLAVKRHVDDLQRLKEYYFDEEEGISACNFFNVLSHWKGEMAGKTIILEAWEAFIVYCIFGWKRKKDNMRRFNYADVLVARKNGKTTIASGIALKMMLADGENGAEVYSAGIDRGQAAICWESSMQIVKSSPILSEMVTCYRNSIFTDITASSYKPLSRDNKTKMD